MAPAPQHWGRGIATRQKTSVGLGTYIICALHCQQPYRRLRRWWAFLCFPPLQRIPSQHTPSNHLRYGPTTQYHRHAKCLVKFIDRQDRVPCRKNQRYQASNNCRWGIATEYSTSALQRRNNSAEYALQCMWNINQGEGRSQPQLPSWNTDNLHEYHINPRGHELSPVYAESPQLLKARIYWGGGYRGISGAEIARRQMWR
jgi:hypothetical protein